MAEVFLYQDVLNALIELEKKGNGLYKSLAEDAHSLETQKLFLFLAEQEANHQKIYEALRAQRYEADEPDADEVAYFAALLATHLEVLNEVTAPKSLPEALKLAKRLEMETILLLSELKHILKVESAQMDVLVGEERRHLKLIYELERHALPF